jgi:hypothetical protein
MMMDLHHAARLNAGRIVTPTPFSWREGGTSYPDRVGEESVAPFV